MTLDEFKKILQCPIHEPELNGKRGSISLYKLLPPTKIIIESICAYLQTQCNPWKSCHDKISELKNTPYFKSYYTSSPYQVKLYRIINNELYYDWPWGDYHNDAPPQSMYEPIFSILSRVSDIGDSVFIMVTYSFTTTTFTYFILLLLLILLLL